MASRSKPAPVGLGTFAGVFTPSILTILGLILFQRLGFVVGKAGLVNMFIILGIAHAISILTSTSLSAIATNMRVKGGGDYYLISRSLGVAYGGALGIVLFLAQSISVAFYCIGLGEALHQVLPPDWGLSAAQIATGAILFLFAFALAGSDWATRLQYLVMAALVMALGSFFIGVFDHFHVETLQQNLLAPVLEVVAEGEDKVVTFKFWTLFALFFPAVTGFTQGVSMSGDLKDPGRSLPSGTFAAIFVSLLIYSAAAVLVSGSMSSHELTMDKEAMSRVALKPMLIVVGVVAATLSSALASFMGAPRILQALASDRIFKPLNAFSRGFGPANNPRYGVVFTLVIALCVVALGGVDAIAPVVSMFFLISYGLLNYATALEARANSPSFRPRFRWFHKRTSMLGALACLAVMIAINPIASALSLALLFILHRYVQQLGGARRWSDGRRDVYYHAVRKNLIAMAKEPVHSRNWRPHMLVFSDLPECRASSVQMASWIEGGAGLTTVVRVVEGQGERGIQRANLARKELAEDIEARDLAAFPLVVSAPYREIATQTVIQSYGLGPISVNTIMLVWNEQFDERSAGTSHHLVRQVQSAARLGVNVVLFHGRSSQWEAAAKLPADQRRIDVWWSPDKSGRLMLLMAYMMTRSGAWQGVKIRLVVAANKRAREVMEKELRQTVDEVRIEAEVHTVAELSPDTLVTESGDASMVFLPLRVRSLAPVDLLGRPVGPMLAALPPVAMVSAVEDIELEADPERGGPAQMAALGDSALALSKRLKRLETELVPARKLAADTRRVAEKTLAALDSLKVKKSKRVGSVKRVRNLERKSRETFQTAAEAARVLKNLEGKASELETDRIRAEGELEALQVALKTGKRMATRPATEPEPV